MLSERQNSNPFFDPSLQSTSNKTRRKEKRVQDISTPQFSFFWGGGGKND
jgi:hypothetical protein